MMTNRSNGPHHNIWTECSGAAAARSCQQPSLSRHHEGGYTLVALLALMTILALFAAAAAPSLQQQARREREKEAMFRGEQVAEAIRLYYSYKASRGITGDPGLPSSIDDLTEGLSIGTKKVQILRRSAARDPLTEDGEWQMVRPHSNELADFVRSVMSFAQNMRPETRDPQLKAAEPVMVPIALPNPGSTPTPSPSSNSGNSSGPFLGVSSQDKTAAVLFYYGIDRHDGWIFTPFLR
jgi:type II secretory pathway pseudopilin PulG